MEISVEAVKALREQTRAGVMDCKRALEEAKGDMERAQEVLRAWGIASAATKASRVTEEGLVESYVHSGARLGALVEVNCETDFVARTPGFKELAHSLAMQVAAMSPKYLDETDIPDGEEADPEEVCLMQQPYVKDPDRTVRDLVNETIGLLGENVRVRRFVRFSLGE